MPLDPATATGTLLVERFEGCRLNVYPDPGTGAEPWTIGWGSTLDINELPFSQNSLPITQGMADQLLSRDMQSAFVTVRRLVTVTVNNNQVAALASFVYNCGAGNFESSTLLKLLNSGDYVGASAQFSRWDKSGGVVLAGLVKRRVAEAAIFNTPV